MADDQDDGAPMWPPTAFARQFQQASGDALEQQTELFKRMMSANSGFEGLSGLGAMGMGTAVFKTRVQSGGRISIPDAEREALDIEEGDIVQTIVLPIKRNR